MSKRVVLLVIPLIAVMSASLLPRDAAVGEAVVPMEDPETAGLLERAEQLHAEGSYALALELYEQLAARDLAAEQRRWIDFRLADSTWRSQAASRDPDDSETERARQALEAMVRDVRREQDRDRIWAEVQESLGDFWWTAPERRNWSQSWAHYRLALDWWAGSSQIDFARERYLSIVRRAARPPRVEPYYVYGYYGNTVPLEILQNMLKIARDPDDRAQAQYLIAMSLRHTGQDRASHRRTIEAFEAAIAAGSGTDWYDDALFAYAQWLEQRGALVREGTSETLRPDYVGALALYRRLTSEFDKGETRYFDQARSQIETITRPVVGVAVSHVFLPGSEIEYLLSWRNVRRVDLALYPVDLTRDVEMTGRNAVGWQDAIDLAGLTPIRRFSHATNDTGEHVPGQETIRLGEGTSLRPGAYLLVARAQGKQARELVLVTGASLVVKTAGSRAIAWFVDALDGSPRSGAEVTLWAGVYERSRWDWSRLEGRTDGDGLVEFDLSSAVHGGLLPTPRRRDSRHWQLFAAASDGTHQAFGTGNGYRRGEDAEQWKIYAFTDRPAYRPGDEVRFKILARLHDGERYSTPSERALRYEIHDARGTTVQGGDLTLNRFGSAWAAITLDETATLGEYRISFHDKPTDRHVGAAVLFRLEEYKLPEFRVEVRPPTDDEGAPIAFRPGDTVEAEIAAEYYFGGPVAGASVEVVVYQKPLWIRWQPPREYPWLYRDMVSQPYPMWNQGQVVHRETLATDAEGRAVVAFTTQAGPAQDFEYAIEARVTDASRREITGRGNVRVSRQGYYAFLHSEHCLYLPGDEVSVTIRTNDANERPVAAEALVTITRDTWTEVWIDPFGKEVAGTSLERMRREARHKPPVERPGGPGWTLKFRGYVHEEISSRRVRTGDDGEAELTFRAERIGYYRIRWSGEDDRGDPVEAETTVWVADPATTHLGYHQGGVGIVVDRETFRAGARAPVMLTAPTEGAYVLFSVEGGELLERRVIHLEGRVKLIEVEIGEQHVPNVFLEAVMVADGQLHVDVQQIVVPPERHYLDVEVAADRETYEPREQGWLTVSTRDHEGRPVAAEVALSLVDESVFYIQQDYAGDPRPFFFGDKRGRMSALQSTFNFKPYVSLEVGDDDTLMPAVPFAQVSYREAKDEVGLDERTVEGARFQRGIADAAKKSMAAPAPAEAEPLSEEAMRQDLDALRYVGGAGAEGEPAVVVRTDFRATALWQPDVVTGDDGTARVKVAYPDTLTAWKATARAATAGNAFGIADTTTRTRKPLIVRLQAPRFFVVGDTATVSAVINNNTDGNLAVHPVLRAEGLDVATATEAAAVILVPANGEARVDWTVDARTAGAADLEVSARAEGLGDAMARSYPVHEHGVDKLIARSGKVHGNEAIVTLTLPAERRPGSTTLTVQLTPSMAVTLLDSLPYLIDYPYGCTEQTMSRFLPSVIVSRALERMGLEPGDVAGRIFGGIEPEHADATHPKGARPLEELRKMTREGLKRLYDFQHGDGGWGWWKEGESDHFMTAYVVWGLALAMEADVQVNVDVLRRARAWLDRELVEREEQPDLQAFMLHALAASAKPSNARWPSRLEKAAFENAFERRDALNAYTRALLALTAHHYGDEERAKLLVRNLVNGVQRDRAPDTSVVQKGIQGGKNVIGTAHWGQDGLWRRWSDGGVEATAFALRALMAIDPGNELVEPVTNWLVRNRRGAQWSNTRDTAISVLALTDYLERSGELATDLEYELLVNGEPIARRRIRPDDVIAAPSRFEIDPSLIRDGDNRIEIRRTAGQGPIYFAAEARFFSLEEPVAAAGNEIFASRRYFRKVPQETLLRGYVYEQVPLGDGGRVVSGERVEVVLTIEAKNDYEYLVFEDLKPAGLEAVELRSGQPLYAREVRSAALDVPPDQRDPADYTGRQRWVYQELRDRKVVAFIDKLPEGIWELRYELRAEVPGRFHALPVLGHAMYVPEIRCNGEEIRLRVEDRD